MFGCTPNANSQKMIIHHNCQDCRALERAEYENIRLQEALSAQVALNMILGLAYESNEIEELKPLLSTIRYKFIKHLYEREDEQERCFRNAIKLLTSQDSIN